ncbi:MAG: hypothetical protein M1820_001021 [Bogoriella megaspora]|nr:MAG: hypothetical protein M1820_001021 [Bogoriella megaspora]
MASYKLPSITAIPKLSTTERAAVLDALFEPSVPLHTLALELLHNETFASYDDLVTAIGLQLTKLAESSSTSDTQWLESILAAHPRLGAKNVESTASQDEQKQLQGDGEEAERLTALNDEYEQKFPGLRYVTFVNGRDRKSIMDDMQQRISSSDLGAERIAAINSICEIASDRAKKAS